MKKKLAKLTRRKKTEQPAIQRITTDTVAEHREKILAGGRRFKYPVQYTRHKLVFNAVIIAMVAVVAMVVLGWWQLYKVQVTDTFFYRITKVLPLPVGSVDGAQVQYSDYLMRYRSQEHWLKQKGQIEQSQQDGERQRNHIKRSVMDGVLLDTYAAKLAREKSIAVTEAEVDEVVTRSLQTANGTISQEQYDASTYDTLGYTRDEYRLLIRQALLRQKVAYAIDTKAQAATEKIQAALKTTTDFAAIAKQIPGTQVGASGLVRKTNQDGGLTQAALALKQGEISGPIKSTSGDGYYFVRLDESTVQELSYSFIKVPLTELTERFAALKSQSKIQEYISIPAEQSQVKQ